MILERLRVDLKESMKNKDVIRKSVIQMLMSGIMTKAKDMRVDTLTEEEELVIVQKELKQTLEVIPDFEKAGRQDLIDDANAKANIIKAYLPKQMNEDEVRKFISDKIQEFQLDITNKNNIRKVVMPLLKGKTDNKIVNQVITNL